MLSIDLSQLNKFSFPKQITFAYLCAERVYPHYQLFYEKHNFGDIQIMTLAIKQVNNAIFSHINLQEINSLLLELDLIIPRPDNFNSNYATIAMYSGGVIYESVNLLKRTDPTRILKDISTMCIDAVDLFIQERDDMSYEDPDFEEKIDNDPLMQQEFQIQTGIISYLTRIDAVQGSDVDTLLQLQKKGTGTLIGLPE